MKKTTPRRLFLKRTVMASTGVALLSSTTALRAFTSEKSPFQGYNPYAEFKTDLRKELFPERTVTIKGTIFDAQGELPLSDAVVEIWHLSPGSTKYRHRGKMITDASGGYEFITDFPNNEANKFPLIYFKVSKGEAQSFSELILAPVGPSISSKHWEEHQQLGKKLLPKDTQFLDHQTITFNLSIQKVLTK